MEQITAKEILKKHFSLLSDEDKLPDNITLDEMAKVLNNYASLRSVSETKKVSDDEMESFNKSMSEMFRQHDYRAMYRFYVEMIVPRLSSPVSETKDFDDEKIKTLATEIYGNDIHSYAMQREGFLVGFKRALKLLPVPVSEASYNAYKEVTDDAIKVLNKEVDDAMGVCDELRLPSNGKEGYGKRESLTLSQRLKYLLPVSEVGQMEEIKKQFFNTFFCSEDEATKVIDFFKPFIFPLSNTKTETKP